MPDGPNIEKLFTETDCLTAQSNLPEICQYLRFYKKEGCYQAYLAKYLPKLAKPEYKEAFDEFIGDVEDKELAKQWKAQFKTVEPEVPPVAAEAVAAPAVKETPVAPDAPVKAPAAPKKKDPKHS